jgi:hypothetical protein
LGVEEVFWEVLAVKITYKLDGKIWVPDRITESVAYLDAAIAELVAKREMFARLRDSMFPAREDDDEPRYDFTNEDDAP